MAALVEIVLSATGGALLTILVTWVTLGYRFERRLATIETRLSDHRPSDLHDRINRLETELEYLEPVFKGLREHGANAARAFFQQVEREAEPDPEVKN